MALELGIETTHSLAGVGQLVSVNLPSCGFPELRELWLDTWNSSDLLFLQGTRPGLTWPRLERGIAICGGDGMTGQQGPIKTLVFQLLSSLRPSHELVVWQSHLDAPHEREKRTLAFPQGMWHVPRDDGDSCHLPLVTISSSDVSSRWRDFPELNGIARVRFVYGVQPSQGI